MSEFDKWINSIRPVKDECPVADEMLRAAFEAGRMVQREKDADIADQHASIEGIAESIAYAIRESKIDD